MIEDVGYPVCPEDIEEIRELASELEIKIQVEDTHWSNHVDKTVSYPSKHSKAPQLKKLIDKSQEKLQKMGADN